MAAGPLLEDREFLLLVEVADRRCGFRSRDVREVHAIVQVTPLTHAPASVEGVIDVRGEIIPVFDLRRRLGLALRKTHLDDCLVLVDTSRQRAAIHVDAVLDLHGGRLVDVEFSGLHVDDASGLARLPDGLVLVFDLARFLTADEAVVLEAALAAFER